jgi:acyl-CoA thioesterase
MEDELISNVKNDRFAEYTGVKVIEVSEGYAVTEITINQNHLNGVGIIQGGVIFTLADFAFALASNSHGITTVGVNVNITYLKSPKGKAIRAVAQEVDSRKRISFYKVDVIDEDGSLIAFFTGLGYKKVQKGNS